MAAPLEIGKDYQLCFAGAEVPQPFQKHFASTSELAATLFPGIRLMHPRVPPHVTSSYLSTLNASQCVEVGKVIAEHSPRLIGAQMSLDGIRFSQKGFGFRVFVPIEVPDTWHRFCEDVENDLDGLTAKHLQSFTRSPHITIGNKRFKDDPLSQLFYQFNRTRMMKDSKKFEGSFPLQELMVWGMDPDDEQRKQVKRVAIPLGGRSKRLFYSTYSRVALA